MSVHMAIPRRDTEVSQSGKYSAETFWPAYAWLVQQERPHEQVARLFAGDDLVELVAERHSNRQVIESLVQDDEWAFIGLATAHM